MKLNYQKMKIKILEVIVIIHDIKVLKKRNKKKKIYFSYLTLLKQSKKIKIKVNHLVSQINQIISKIH